MVTLSVGAYDVRIGLECSRFAINVSLEGDSCWLRDGCVCSGAAIICITAIEVYTVGETPHGKRVVIPITGGTFEGPLLKGTILNGGADYQLASSDGKRTELEAIYSIKTDDGTYIHVRNRGIIANDKDAEGHPTFYFKAAPQFEAPFDSPYAWLNNAIYVCQPEWGQQFAGIVLNVWKVK